MILSFSIELSFPAWKIHFVSCKYSSNKVLELKLKSKIFGSFIFGYLMPKCSLMWENFLNLSYEQKKNFPILRIFMNKTINAVWEMDIIEITF